MVENGSGGRGGYVPERVELRGFFLFDNRVSAGGGRIGRMDMYWGPMNNRVPIITRRVMRDERPFWGVCW